MEDQNTQLIVKVASGVVAAAVISFVAWRCMKKTDRKEYPQDTVILHQLSRGPYAPTISQFILKLETYLRMANIPYRNVHSRQKSKKGKYPWIEYNGEEICDTEFIIEYLNEKFEIDLNKQYSATDLAIARAFQKMLEENTFWAVTLDRWLFDKESTGLRLVKLHPIGIFFLRRLVKKSTYYHGIGRHSKEEVYHILDLDLKSLSEFLGKKKFLLGDEPCQADASVFGQLGQIYWHGFGNPCYTVYFKKYKNLCDYCERMKDKFWPDWEQCITKGGTQKATK